MKKARETTQKTIHALLSGVHPLVKKYAGKHVLVINNEIVLLATGKRGMNEFKRLKEKHGRPPILTFIPQPSSSYILIF